MDVYFWGETTDSSIEIVSLSQATLKGALNVLRTSYFTEELSSVAVDLAKYPKACDEIEELLYLSAAKDGVSLVAVEKSTQRVVGVLFNKLHVQTDGDTSCYTKYWNRCKHESSKALVQSMIKMDEKFNLFDFTKTDCMLEAMAAAVLPDYRRRGITRKLEEATIELVKALESGENVKVPIDDALLPIGPTPCIICGYCSTSTMERLMNSLGFITARKISYEEFAFRGETFASRIDQRESFITIVYLPVENFKRKENKRL